MPSRHPFGVPSRRHPGVSTVLALTVAVLAISLSGPLIAYTLAPPLAIALWRNAFSVAAVVPVAALTRRGEVARAGPRVLLVGALAGVALAGHFATWVPSAKLTAVATATALGATQPVWQCVIARAQGRVLPRQVWCGVILAVSGAALAGGVDFAGASRAFTGDLLALASAVTMACYVALGERARTRLSTIGYTSVCYPTATLVLLVVCLIGQVPLSGFPAASWLAITVMALGPQLLGHSMFSYALHRISATTVAMLILLEVPGAGLISWVWLGQAPARAQWPGLALVLIGVAVVTLAPGAVTAEAEAST